MKTLKFYVVFLFFSFFLSVSEGPFGMLVAGATTLYSLEELKILKKGPSLNPQETTLKLPRRGDTLKPPNKGDTLNPPRKGDTLKLPNKGTPLNPSQKKPLSHQFPCAKAFSKTNNDTSKAFNEPNNSPQTNLSIMESYTTDNAITSSSTTFNYHASPTYNYEKSDGHPTKKKPKTRSTLTEKNIPLEKSFSIRQAEKNLRKAIPHIQKELQYTTESEAHLKLVRRGLRHFWRTPSNIQENPTSKNLLNSASRKHLYNRNKAQIVKKREHGTKLKRMLHTAKAYRFYFKNKKHFQKHIKHQMNRSNVKTP